MEKKTTSIKIKPDLWKEVRIYCISNNIQVSAFVEDAIKKRLEKK